MIQMNNYNNDASLRITTTLLYSPRLAERGEPHISTTGSSRISPIYLQTFHLDRLLASARALDWPLAAQKVAQYKENTDFDDLVEQHIKTQASPAESQDQSHRVRVLISKESDLEVESSRITSTLTRSQYNGTFFPFSFSDQIDSGSQQFCEIHVDTAPTVPSLFTTHKTNHRPHYDVSRSRTGITHLPATSAEVLLFNPNGEIMEASLSTVYFLRGGKWITPQGEIGGNIGVTRRWALNQRLCVEGVVTIQSLKQREVIWISNAVRGFIPGMLDLGNGQTLINLIE